MGFMLGTAAGEPQKTSDSKVKTKGSVKYQASNTIPKKVVIWVPVTGSLIPQRVVLRGQQADTASPLYVVQSDEFLRSGATSVGGMLSLDPSISSGHGVGHRP